jgi:hypothetical protein
MRANGLLYVVPGRELHGHRNFSFCSGAVAKLS